MTGSPGISFIQIRFLGSYSHIVGQLLFSDRSPMPKISFSTQIGICSVQIIIYFNPAEADWRLFLYEASLTEIDVGMCTDLLRD